MVKRKCRKIYREAFKDPDLSFERLLFKHCYKYCVSIKRGLSPVSMYFALPCVLKTDNERRNAIYFYAAATDEKNRGRGYMAELIKRAKKKHDLIFLRPAEPSLISYYSRFGFKTATATEGFSEIELQPFGGYGELIGKIGSGEKEKEYVLMYYSKKEEAFDKIGFAYSMN